MKTNKFLLIALAAAGLMTACSNNEEVKTNQGNAVSFRLQGGMPEAKTTATQLANVDAFVVYGNDDVTLDLFENGATVALQVGGGFSYAPTRYYDDAAAVAAFAAYSPASANFSAVSASDVLGSPSTFDFKVVAPTADGNTSQIDLLFATANVPSPSAAPVPLAFTHALSRVFVAAKNTTADPVTIKKLTLKEMISEGTISVPAGAASWNWTYPSTPVRDDYEYVLAPSGVIVPGQTTTNYVLVTSMEQGMMILPQTLDASCVLEVEYEFANLAPQTKQFNIAGNTSSVAAFAINSQYSINIEFTGTAVSFNITVAGFGTPITDVLIP